MLHQYCFGGKLIQQKLDTQYHVQYGCGGKGNRQKVFMAEALKKPEQKGAEDVKNNDNRNRNVKSEQEQQRRHNSTGTADRCSVHRTTETGPEVTWLQEWSKSREELSKDPVRSVSLRRSRMEGREPGAGQHHTAESERESLWTS